MVAGNTTETTETAETAEATVTTGALLELPDDGLLVLYDGVCGMCNGLVRFLIRRDRHDKYRFAPLQSALGKDLVQKHGGDPEVLSTMYVFSAPGQATEKIWRRGRGALVAIAHVGGGWRVLGALRILPDFLINFGYNLVAKRRYRLFGKLESCPIPDPDVRHKFVAL